MRCLIRSHHQDYKLPVSHEEGEAGGSLEPDPRYGRCCSTVCRPGYALRDALLGLLVLLGLAVIVTVIFVVCFYVLPDEKHLVEEGLLASTAEGIIREPVEVNEITLRDGDAYNVVPNDPGKSTAGRSQDFNTFSTTANFEDTTTQLSSADASQFTVFQDASDVVSPSRDAGQKPGLQGRENFEDDNFHKHREGQNEKGDRHNLGHKGERPVLEGEDDLFQGEGSRKEEEEIDFFADLSPQAACGPVQLPMCTTAVPWNSAGKPNWLGHLADQDVFASLATVRRLLVESQCSPLAPLYACSILEPPCREAVVLPPCRNFCLDVARSCEVPASSGLADMFDCERFPDSTDPNICVSAQQEETTTLTTPTKTAAAVKSTTTPPAITTTTTTEAINENFFTANQRAETSMTLQRDHKPSTKRSTHIFPSPTASPSDAPTAMSLADRLKLAMSGSSTDSSLAVDRHRRPSSPRRPATNTVNVENSSTAASNSGGFSLASRLSSVVTENPRRSENTARPKSISSGSDASPTVTSFTGTSDEPTDAASNTGALSLAERLALRNKAKESSKPANRLQGRRQPPTSNNRFTTDFSSTPTETPRRHQTGLRNRFTSISPDTEVYSSLEAGDIRRIPVRAINEVPRFKLNFPKRYSTTERSVTFRTTAELPSTSTTEGTTAASGIPSIAVASSTTVERRIPLVTSTTEVIATTERELETSKKVSSTTELATPETCEELQCLDGKCIAINQLNDGVTDCSDGSDEQDFGGLVT